MSTGLEALYADGYSDFKHNLKHSMENIRDQYNIDIRDAALIENIDNCIDEPGYTSLKIEASESALTLRMTGTGIPAETFGNLAEIAGTTKSGKSGLGHYGWGMKVALWVASPITIYTRRDGFKGAQEWIMQDGTPKYRFLSPPDDLNADETVVKLELKDELKATRASETPLKIKGYYTKEKVLEILRKYYPTLINGAPVLGRRIEVSVNGERAGWQEPAYDKKKPVGIKIEDAEEATGYLYYLKKGYDEQSGLSLLGEVGVAVIVHGRVIKVDKFTQPTDKVTGYIHANALEDDVSGDKTTIRPSSRWQKLRRAVSGEISVLLKEAGEEDKFNPSDLVREINKEINSVIKDMDEFSDFASPDQGYRVALRKNPAGSEHASLAQTGHLASNASSGGDKNSPVAGGSQQLAPLQQDPQGQINAEKKEKRSKSKVQVLPTQKPGGEECWYTFKDGYLTVFVNSEHPLYKKAENESQKTLRFHMTRCAFEALGRYIAEERKAIREYTGVANERERLIKKWQESWKTEGVSA